MATGIRSTNFLRHCTLFAALLSLLLFSTPSDAQTDGVLTIGDKAPALDIEHWMSDRDGKFAEFSGFEKDKVYIVEFWATWCGPCISSMPHLVEIQDEYADKDVQIISVSREDLETVETFLERTVRGDKDKTYGELTSAYCLTTDPDGSVDKDYMRAAGQNGIPSAFIVGKTGEIEWIGHPASIDKTLKEIVEDKYDREAFAKKFAPKQKSDLLVGSISTLMQAGEYEEALEAVDSFIASADDNTTKRMLSMMKRRRSSIALNLGGDVAIEAYKTMIEEAGDSAVAIASAASQVVRIRMAGKDIDDEIVEMACESASKAVKIAEEGGRDAVTARIMSLHANLLHVCEKTDDAIAVLEKAVELSDDKRHVKLLEKLKKEREESKG